MIVLISQFFKALFSQNFYQKVIHPFFENFRHSSKNYGLVMTGQAAAAPVIALLTEFLSPALGWLGMFFIIAGASIVSCTINMRYPKHPSPKVLLERLQRPPPSQL